jgi:hypothetical protein
MKARRLGLSGLLLAAGIGSFLIASAPEEAEAQLYCGDSTGNVCQKIEFCIDVIVIRTCTASFKYYAP